MKLAARSIWLRANEHRGESFMPALQRFGVPAFALALSALLGAAPAGAATYTTLHSFSGGADGANPEAGLTLIGSTLYGTTNGGAAGYGTVFKFDPVTTTLTPVHSFSNSPDGAYPTTPFILVNNTLYAETQGGGADGFGSVYTIDTNTGTESVLYSFTGGADGKYPNTNMAYDHGLLYGASQGGTNNNGYVFAIDPSSGAETTLHTFVGTDGNSPDGNLIVVKGLLYGTTQYGGAGTGGTNREGTIYQLDPMTGALSDTYSFTGAPTGSPSRGLTYLNGTLYGGTINSKGALFSFKLSKDALKVFHKFTGKLDGAWASGPMVYYNGLLYGVTSGVSIGSRNYTGAIFSYDPTGHAFTVLYTYPDEFGGQGPIGSLVPYNGALYGVTYGYGTANKGSVFMITP